MYQTKSSCFHRLIFCFSTSGKAQFTDELVEKWKKTEEEQFGHDPALLKWVREGGEFP